MKAVSALGCSFLAFSAIFAGGQGFVNLDFEQATLSPTAPGVFGTEVSPSVAFPGWTVTAPFTLYNNLTLGSPAQVLSGPQFPNAIGLTPLQGSYSALMQFGPLTEMGMAGPSFSQTGLVPSNARTVTFLAAPGSMDPVVSLNGSEIPLASLGGGRMGGDVTSFAGQQAQLTFATRDYSAGPIGLYFDDVEPTFLAIVAASGLAALLCARRNRGVI